MDLDSASCLCSTGERIFKQGLCFADYGRKYSNSYGAISLRSSNFPDCFYFQWYIEFCSNTPQYIYVKRANQTKESPSATFIVKIGQHAPIRIDGSAGYNNDKSYMLSQSYISMMNNYTLTVNVTLSISLTGKYVNLAKKRKHSFEEQFKQLLNDQLASDVTLVSNNGEFNAHWAVLAARSPYFSAMLKNDYKEKQENRTKLDVDFITCKKMLEFIYSNEVVIDNEADGKSLLKAGGVYLLDGLKDAAENFLCRRVTPTNALEFLFLSHHHSAGGLKKVAIDECVKNLESLTRDPGFSDLLKDADLVAELFMRASSKMSSQYSVLIKPC